MRRLINSFRLCFFIAVIWLQSCIYDYPRASKSSHGIGEDPTTVETFIEVNFELDWQEMVHRVDFESETKATTLRPYRFIIEVTDDNGLICHDIINLSDNEYINGRLRHRLSVPLGARRYAIAAWYDHQNDSGDFPFNADNLGNVVLLDRSTRDAEAVQCAFASDYIDLREYDIAVEKSYSKNLKMAYPGARFEIVATDIQQFITDNREALFQDETFYAHLSFPYGYYQAFNVYSKSVNYIESKLELSGWMRLPYAEYDELKIAEGFLFCNEEETVSTQLWVTNSALITVSQTGEFQFPVKRGYLTTVSGNFLTNSIDGMFSIDNVWEGEIPVYID